MCSVRSFLGIDYHKMYSVVSVQSDSGDRLFHGKVPNTPEAFAELLAQLPKPAKAVLEASRTWEVLYDILTDLGVETLVAHPTQLRAIAAAQIKTDKRDADILATLLRANLIPAVHVPSRETRRVRQMLRQRLFLVRTRTRIKNRIHHLLDRNRISNLGLTDIFGKTGRQHMGSVALPKTERLLLERGLAHLDFLESQRKELETQIEQILKLNPAIKYLQSIPGIGKTLAALIALEIDAIHRFPDAAHLAAYAGLVPAVHSSGGSFHHGPLLRACNRLLKWALIEAAWKAQVSSAYCRSYFQARRKRLGPNPAVVALARRLAHIVYAVLKEQRCYEERPFCPSRPRVRLAL